MDLGLQDRGVLVTGASGGIGAATARAFAAEGARVACHYHRNEEAGRALAVELDGVAVGGDLRDVAAANTVVARAAARLGRLDVVVANAGVWPAEELPVWELPYERWRDTVTSNLDATFLTVRAYLRHLADRPTGGIPDPPSIVLVASTAGEIGEAGHADYAAAKSAIAIGLARSLKNEIVRLHPRARVNVVAPGWTASPMTADALDDPLVARLTATMPLRKVATVDDVAAAIVWLSSPVAAGHLTGQVVTVAGGMEGRLLHDG